MMLEPNRLTRGVLAIVFAAAAAGACGDSGRPEAGASGDSERPKAGESAVAVDGGLVAGVPGAGAGAVRMYGSIPYAAAPVGERRWLPPQPVEPWDGVRDGSQLPPACPQGILPVPPESRGSSVRERPVWTRTACTSTCGRPRRRATPRR